MRRILFSTIFICALIGHCVAERKMKIKGTVLKVLETDTSAKLKDDSSDSSGTRVLEIQSETGKVRRVDLHKHMHPDKAELLTTELFVSPDDKVICTEKCKNSNCDYRCIEEESVGYTYFTGDKALYIENSDTGSYLDLVVSDDMFFGKKRSRRDKQPRSLEPDFNSVGIVNINYVVDAAFMRVFQDLVGGSLMAAKTEVELFVTLANTRVALYFATLKQYKRQKLDLTIHMNSVTFPVETGDGFSDIAPIANNTDGNNLLIKDYYDESGNYLGLGGVLASTAYYMRELYGAQLDLDLVSFLTGLDLVVQGYTRFDNGTESLIYSEPNVIGVAFVRSFCRSWENYAYDLRFNFNELFSTFTPRIVAHEIGHNLGAGHDESFRCPSNALTVMAPFAIARLEGYEQYDQFSSCSAGDIGFHFSSIPKADLNQCLKSEPPSQAEFLEKFCTGFLGDSYTLDAQCKILFGVNSSLCTYGDPLLEAGYLPEGDCITSYDYDIGALPIFWCSQDGDCANTDNAIDHPFDGSKCALGGVQGDAICYTGECSSEVTLCAGRKKRNASYQPWRYLRNRIKP